MARYLWANSIGRRNNSIRRVAVGRRKRRSDRAALRSPGRPPAARREHRQQFWEQIAKGLSSEEAGALAGVSSPAAARWFRQGGGMSPISLGQLSGRYLSFAEREEVAVLHASGCGVREIARRTGRSPSTVSRELRRNAAKRCGFRTRRSTRLYLFKAAARCAVSSQRAFAPDEHSACRGLGPGAEARSSSAQRS